MEELPPFDPAWQAERRIEPAYQPRPLVSKKREAVRKYISRIFHLEYCCVSPIARVASGILRCNEIWVSCVRFLITC